MLNRVEDIRKKWAYRADAEEENENQKPKKKKHSALSTRLPFGLCKDAGIDTTGMTPREAWDAYYGKTGISPEDVKEEKFEEKEEPKEEPKGEHEELFEEPEFEPSYTKKELEKELGATIKEIEKAGGLKAEDDGWVNPVTGEFYSPYEGEKLIKHMSYYQNEKGNEPTESEKALSDALEKAIDAKKEYDNIYKTATSYKDLEKKLEETSTKYYEAVDGWLDALEKNDYQFGESDYSSMSDDELNDADESYYAMMSFAGKITNNEKFEKVNKNIRAEREKIAKEFKDRIKREEEEELKTVGEDGEDVDENALGSMSDEDLDLLEEKIQQRHDWFEDRVFKYFGLGARRDAAKELRKEATEQLKKIQNEREKREEHKIHERYGNISEAKPTEPKYNAPVMQDYASRVKPPEINTGIVTLDNWQGCADDYVNNVTSGKVIGHKENELWGLDSDGLVNLQEGLQSIFDNADFCLNINSENVEKALSTHVKNQFETGTTDGSDDLEARANMSKNIFGTPGDTDEVEREKYGYLADKDSFDCTLGKDGPSYGDSGSGVRCTLTFKRDNVANRTTYTFRDSLSACYDSVHKEYAAGMVDTNCSIEGVSYWMPFATKIAEGSVKSLSDIYKGSCGFRYCEAQYHGLVTAKDIDSIRFRSVSEMRKAIKAWGPDAMRIARENGIRFAYFNQIEGKFTYMTAEETEETVKSLY